MKEPPRHKLHQLHKQRGREDRGRAPQLLDEAAAGSDPFDLFHRWFSEAQAAALPLPEAMTLATVGSGARPSARMVLLKDYGVEGFTFYTNYNSRKAEEIRLNPHASLLFFWVALDRQIRIEGALEKVSRQVSQAYFRTRPRGSQIGAHISPQSRPISSRRELEESYAQLEQSLEGRELLPPENWGGYCLGASYFEFWQGRPDRLHDRFAFRRSTEGWERSRLAP